MVGAQITCDLDAAAKVSALLNVSNAVAQATGRPFSYQARRFG